MIKTVQNIRRLGIVGVNARNARYIMPSNNRSDYPKVDDKLLTKEIAQEAGLAIPGLYGVLRYNFQVRYLPKLLEGLDDFVVKPAQGSGGDGIWVVVGRLGDRFRLASGEIVTLEELEYHIETTLSGIYSLGGQPDKVLFEYRIKFDPLFEKVAYQGVPDVRIITYLGIPAMCMVRLPTRQSRGRANLHQGAIGVGVDIATGQTLTAVWNSRVVTEHPDTHNPVSGLTIPYWDDMLLLAARSQQLTGLGYQGIDIVLDNDLGPLILELNARPGLAIQIANQAGLKPRFDAIEAHAHTLTDNHARVAFAKENFAAALPM
ncbi:MAG: alpha-L-glutamate ligase-like protein [Alphaproteobacteria bacterium]|nr:alpha-L-glutamate ligase-like protein [Alphaproteobacteria bacterium]